MEITIRNITQDTMKDFNNDHTILLPMEEDALRKFMGDDEWAVIDCPIGEEQIDALQLNALLKEYGEETLLVLSKFYFLDEIMESDDYTIVDFKEETKSWNYGNGAYPDDWAKGYVLHKLEYASFPFAYTPEMEGYVKFEQLWYTAEADGWREVKHNGKTYLVRLQ